MTGEQWQELLAHGRRLMTLAEMASMAVFIVSDNERDDGNDGQPDDGQSGRLAVIRVFHENGSKTAA